MQSRSIVTEINANMGKSRHFVALSGLVRCSAMSEFDNAVSGLRDRLVSMQSEIEKGFEALAAETDRLCGIAQELQAEDDSQEKRLRQLEERAEGQSELIDTLSREAEEARSLRAELKEKDLGLGSVNAELESKSDLVRALREQLDRATGEIESLRREIKASDDIAAEETVVDSAELDALRAELEARKSMIRNLREENERATGLEAQLEAKRETITALEESIDQHVETAAKLRASVDTWKKKYQAARGELTDVDQTLAEPPAFTETEAEVLRQLEDSGFEEPERTIAIDMRSALKEARARKAGADS